MIEFSESIKVLYFINIEFSTLVLYSESNQNWNRL